MLLLCAPPAPDPPPSLLFPKEPHHLCAEGRVRPDIPPLPPFSPTHPESRRCAAFCVSPHPQNGFSAFPIWCNHARIGPRSEWRNIRPLNLSRLHLSCGAPSYRRYACLMPAGVARLGSSIYHRVLRSFVCQFVSYHPAVSLHPHQFPPLAPLAALITLSSIQDLPFWRPEEQDQIDNALTA